MAEPGIDTVSWSGAADLWDEDSGAIVAPDYFDASPAGIKVRVGGSFVIKPIRHRASGVWAAKPVKARIAGAWVLT